MFSFGKKNTRLSSTLLDRLHSHQQYMRVPVASHFHQHLASSVFQILAVLTGAWWCLVFTCISLMTCYMEHPFIFLFAISVSSLVSYLRRLLAHCLIRLFILLSLSLKASLYIWDNAHIWCDFCACFLPACALSFHSFDGVIHEQNLILMKPCLSTSSFMDDTFLVIPRRASSYPKLPRFYPTLSSKDFIVLHFPLRSIIHLELTFAKDVRFGSRCFFFFMHMHILLF